MTKKRRQASKPEFRFVGMDAIDEEGQRWTRFSGNPRSVLEDPQSARSVRRAFVHQFRDLQEIGASAGLAAVASGKYREAAVSPTFYSRSDQLLLVLEL